MPLQPTRNEEIEAVREARRILGEWFEGYNDVDVEYLRDRCHYPLVSFGGGRVRWQNLSFTVRQERRDFVPNNRDAGWDFSLIDRWAVHQHTATKSHLVTDFSRLRSDGTPYAAGLSRLAVITKEQDHWGVKVLSSCGMRNPASMERDEDAEITAEVTNLIDDYFDAYRRGDDEAVESFYNYPLVTVDGTETQIADGPDELNISHPNTDESRGELLSMEVLPPQAGDKVVVDVNVERKTDDGSLEREGAILLVTKQKRGWGIQLRSVETGSTIVP